jgi:carbon-monoxide dehydrogenase catalytic subunit
MGLQSTAIIQAASDRSPLVQVLTQTAKDLLGGYFIVEPDPKAAAGKLVAAIKERRQGLGV